MLKRTLIGIATLMCAILAFIVRLIPLSYIFGTGDMLGAPDSWYNLRLVEDMLQHGNMLDYDVMTGYPYGSIVNWGFMYTSLSAFLAILTSAVTRVQIIDAVSWLSPIMASLMVVIMYFIGKAFGDWKTGLLTALFTAIIGGQYFLRSVYGLFDHHIAEVLFSCIFCLCYILALRYSQNASFKSLKTLKIPILLGLLTGLAYLMGLFTMTTLVVYGLFVMVYTLFQFIFNDAKNKSSDYLVIINGMTFLIAIIGLLIYGIKLYNLELTGYSLGLIAAQALALCATILLWAVTKIPVKQTKIKPVVAHIGILLIITILLSTLCAVINYDLFNMVVYNIQHQFLPSVGGISTIQEASAWSFNNAWMSFNVGLILAVLGFGLLCYNFIKKQESLVLFLICWTVCSFIFACAQIRWEYYLAPLICVLSAIFVTWCINTLVKEITLHKEKHKKRKRVINKFNIIVPCIILILTCVFVGISVTNDITISDIYGKTGDTNDSWQDACEWLQNNTPEISIRLQERYDANTFTYPDDVYTTIAWWDFGHYISVIGNRVSVANPFQANVNKVAEILMETDEKRACELMDAVNAKYIMVDYDTGNNFIPVMAIWLNRTLKTQKDIYNTLTFRLYNLEGRGNDAYGIAKLEHFKLVYTSARNGERPVKIFEYV